MQSTSNLKLLLGRNRHTKRAILNTGPFLISIISDFTSFYSQVKESDSPLDHPCDVSLRTLNWRRRVAEEEETTFVVIAMGPRCSAFPTFLSFSTASPFSMQWRS